MADRVASAHFVGRDSESRKLAVALAAALAGDPRLALITGEAGVGKTRLLAELAEAAAGRGARVLRGECVELGDGELAYAPFTAALRPLVRDRDPALDAVGPGARRALARLLPGLAAAAEAPAEDRSGDGHPDRAQVFEALLELLQAVAAGGGLLLVIDDLHWADAMTRDVLRLLLAGLSDEQVLVAVAARDDELAAGHPLRPFLVELDRHPRAERVDLAPFSRQEVAEQAGAITGAADPETVARLWERTAGNPLLVEELLAAGPGAPLPATLRETLVLRLERFSPAAQDVVRAVAVGGRVSDALLGAVCGLDYRTLRPALREAVAVRILDVGDDGRCGVRHALLREAVLADLLPGERVELHARFAASLAEAERPSCDARIAIATHTAATGDVPGTLRTAVEAAQACRASFAFEEAVVHFERALAVWDEVPDADAVAGMPRARVLTFDADAHRRTDRPVRSAELLQEAAGLIGERDPLWAAVVLEKLADRRWALGELDAARAAAAQGYAVLDRKRFPDPLLERARLLASEAKEASRAGDWAAAIARGRDALAEGEGSGDVDSVVRALDAIGLAQAGLGDFPAALATLDEAVARADHDPTARLVSAGNRVDATGAAGQLPRARELAAAVREQEREFGHRGRFLALRSARLELLAGDVAAARAALPAPAQPGMGMAFVHDAVTRAEIAIPRGEAGEARERLDAAAAAGVTAPHRPAILARHAAARAELECEAGDLRAARAAIDAALAELDGASREPAATVAVCAAGALVEVGTGSGDAARAMGFLERIDATGAAGPERPLEHAHRLDTAAVVAGDPAAWRAAAEAWRAVGIPACAVRASVHAARVALEQGSRDLALECAATARADAGGADHLARAVEAFSARARLGADADRGSRPGGAGDPFDLTERERQVLALVATGRRNREIGEALFMAEKTASVHVSRILAKLGVRSRTEAAALALQHGLVDDG